MHSQKTTALDKNKHLLKMSSPWKVRKHEWNQVKTVPKGHVHTRGLADSASLTIPANLVGLRCAPSSSAKEVLIVALIKAVLYTVSKVICTITAAGHADRGFIPNIHALNGAIVVANDTALDGYSYSSYQIYFNFKPQSLNFNNHSFIKSIHSSTNFPHPLSITKNSFNIIFFRLPF